MMPVESHDLAHDFPELRAQIHKLKLEDAHFARLFSAYEALDREVRRMETDIEPVADKVVEEAKKKRLALKDELYKRLHAPQAG
jgi:uncharacterized protein